MSAKESSTVARHATPEVMGKPALFDRRTRFILFALVLGIVWTWASSFRPWGWITAAAIVCIEYALYITYAYRYRDGLIARLLIFGLAAGFVELLGEDQRLVDVTGTLVYAPNEPFILRSPLYMPFAWGSVLVQLGYLGWWLSQRWSLPLASLGIGLIGALTIPLYEEWAKGAGWWFYRNTRMLSNAPWYIIGGEFLIVLTLPLMIRAAEKARPGWSIALGVLQGLWIWVAYALAFALLR